MAAATHTVTWGKRLLLLLLLAFIIIQFVPKNRWSNELIAEEQSMAAMMQPPQEVETLLASACYDCHAYGTEYPWYANVAPVSFWIDNHVNEGRYHLNFSEWASYSTKEQRHLFEECAEEVSEGEMPLESYTWLHGEAQLSDAQRKTLAEWFRTQMVSLSQQPESLEELKESEQGEEGDSEQGD